MFELARPNKGRAGIGALWAMGLYFLELIFLLLIVDSLGSGMEHSFLTMVLGAPLIQSLYIVPRYFAWKGSGKGATANGLLGGAVGLAIIHYGIVGLMALVG